MSAQAIEKAARGDPDAQPLTETDIERMKRTPQAKIIRRALELTQEEFAARYHIPLGTLRDWEQSRADPDQPTRAYLTLIARDPEYVNRKLNAELSLEIGARLMRPGRHVELGLSESEAAELGSHYRKMLLQKHGEKANIINEQVKNAYPLRQGSDPSKTVPGAGVGPEPGARRGVAGSERQVGEGAGDAPGSGSGGGGSADEGTHGNPVKRLFDRIRGKAEPGKPNDSTNYSGLGAAKDKTVRNLSQLEEASPKAHEAAVRAASSRAQVSVILRGAAPKIMEALRTTGVSTWQEMRQALIESRLHPRQL
jgi:putative transcriptional regulator